MSVKNFRFVSPGVFVNEIDNSQLPASPAGIGPVVIGRAEKGPGLRPVTVNSFSEFVQVFGTPIAGNPTSDVWRRGANVSAPAYGMYAAQAYLRNSAPLTYIRLLGNQAPASELEAVGKAGWDVDGQAWGLVVFEGSDFASAGTGALEGVLAGIFYTEDSSCTLQMSGSAAQCQSSSTAWGSTGATTYTGSSLVVKDTGRAKQFTMIVNKFNSQNETFKTVFNFDINSSKYIRKVFNTTPALANEALYDNELNYFLGETFDRFVSANITGSANNTFASVVKLYNGSSTDAKDFRAPLQSAQTPAIIGCDVVDRIGANSYNVETAPTLFTVHALNQPGDWSNRNLKISIQDIKASTNEADPYGQFSLVVRHLSDSDNVVRVVEQFNDLNLNPESLNYIARKVGDKSLRWDDTERRYIEEGEWNNVSNYIRVAVNEQAVGENAALLPFGFKGILKYLDEDGTDAITTASGSGNWVTSSAPTDEFGRFAAPSGGLAPWWSTASVFVVTGSGLGGARLTASVFYPAPEFRTYASSGSLNNPTDAYFGFQTSRAAGSTLFDGSNIDLLRPRGGMVASMFGGPVADESERSQFFTLDDISGSGVWVAGAHAAGTSLTNISGAISGVLDKGYDRFTVPMYGGFDGLNILELEPFRNSQWSGTPTETNSYAFKSIRQSIDAISDPEVVEMNLATIPGLKQPGLTTNLMTVCEDRADALAIVDLEGGYQARAEAKVSARNNTSTQLRSTITQLRDRGLNSSYGCCFYPWVRARDSINGANVWLPPSIAALGTFSSSQRKTQVWFAPAGFNRGGLTEGSAGIPVIDVAHQLTRKNRDDLYAANINPIAKFPAEGIVIFGQKTLQVTPSALDRINVRRLMIFVKKRISQVATTILFDPNVETTWARFISAAKPILADIKTNFGLSDYKLVLDNTTTTPDLIDRNIMYAQIFLKPTRAIEYIAIDFNITRTGASFDD